MTKESKLILGLLIASLPFAHLSPFPALALTAVFLLTRVMGAAPEKKTESKPDETEDQRAALKALGALYTELEAKVQEIQTEVNGLVLRNGFNMKKGNQ